MSEAEPPFGGDATETVLPSEATTRVRRFHLTVVSGPQKKRRWDSVSDRCSIGSHAGNDLAIDDPTVSRFHCEILLGRDGPRARDLGSRNGTVLDGVGIVEGFPRDGSVLQLGKTGIRFSLDSDENSLQLSERSEFGSLTGVSPAMRAVFAVLEQAAPTQATILLEGETGTGKEVAAESIHDASPRRDKPFRVVDCGAIPRDILESELFGHERGAFTGATARRIGTFEEADGGTVFLDEVGELPLDLQPKLLRVLEQREIRRVGTNQYLPVDVRLVAATNRDLRAEVNAGRFRPDLYFRLAVVKVKLPSLSTRPEDIPLLVDRILASLGASPEVAGALQRPEFIATLQRSAWSGNVRELRNFLERCVVFQRPLPTTAGEPPPSTGLAVDASLPYEEARRLVLERFERSYLEALLRAHAGNVAAAARAAGLHRASLYRLVSRHGLV